MRTHRFYSLTTWVKFTLRRAKELFFSDTTPSRIQLGLWTSTIGWMFWYGQVGSMDSAMYASLVQFAPIKVIGAVGIVAGLLGLLNPFFHVADDKFRMLEHFGMSVFWLTLAVHSLYSGAFLIVYWVGSSVSLWVTTRMEDDV